MHSNDANSLGRFFKIWFCEEEWMFNLICLESAKTKAHWNSLLSVLFPFARKKKNNHNFVDFVYLTSTKYGLLKKSFVLFWASQIANLEFADELVVVDCKPLTRNENKNPQTGKKKSWSQDRKQSKHGGNRRVSVLYKPMIWPTSLFPLLFHVYRISKLCNWKMLWHCLLPVYITGGTLVS